MVSDRKLFVEFPVVPEASLHWWLARDGVVVQKGRGPDPLNDSGLDQEISEVAPIATIALVASAMTNIRWHNFDAALTDRQKEAAAIVEAREQSLQNDRLYVAAIGAVDDAVATAAMDRDLLSMGLVHLQSIGIDPDVIAPSGWLIPDHQDSVVQANFGFDSLLRTDRLIAPDESSLREYILDSRSVTSLSDTDLDAALGAADLNDMLNLRSGLFSKKLKRGTLTPTQKNILAGMTAALLLVSICVPVAQLLKYHLAANDADSLSLSAAQSTLGQGAKLETAEAALDERLIAESRGSSIFSVPSSALFSALQQAPAVTLDGMSYQSGGVVSATLTAVRNEDINPVLVALQAAGFVITAKPRIDATGTANADITVRTP